MRTLSPTPQTPGAMQHERGQTLGHECLDPRRHPQTLSDAARKGSTPPNPRSNAVRKGSNFHSDTSASGPLRQHPQTTGAMRHQRSNRHPETSASGPQPRSNAARKGSTRKQVLPDPVANTPEQCSTKGVKPALGNQCFRTSPPTPPKPPEQCSTKGVEPALGNKCFRTPSPTREQYIQHERASSVAEINARIAYKVGGRHGVMGLVWVLRASKGWRAIVFATYPADTLDAQSGPRSRRKNSSGAGFIPDGGYARQRTGCRNSAR